MTDYSKIEKNQAKKSIKSLMYELTNLTPSALMTFFEIDLSSTVGSIQSSLLKDYQEISEVLPSFQGQSQNVLRFHNNIRVFNSIIFWQGNTFFPAPLKADGFDITSRGVLPTPTLSITSQKEDGIEALSVLRRTISKYGDIVGAKVTRIRTYAKFLDKTNFSDISEQNGTQGIYASNFPEGYEPDPYAELPRDIFFVERKSQETKTGITYELSSILDVEGVKLPRRRVLSKKCGFTYRGCGCFYEGDGNEAQSLADNLYSKCQIRRSDLTLPEDAPPVANIRDESIKDIIGVSDLTNKGSYNSLHSYEVGDYVKMKKNNINYYFVARKAVPSSQGSEYAPPNPDYWIADLCSKTLNGCRKRWGPQGAIVVGDTTDFVKGELQFGGFPNATKLEQNLGQ